MHRPALTYGPNAMTAARTMFSRFRMKSRSQRSVRLPRARRAEIDRVKRKRPDSLDAYDLVLRAQMDVDSGMPERVARALMLLERAIELDPAYALAHGNAAMCHHCLFLRASRAASIHHARSAILHGQDDAAALTLPGFSIGMDGHDRGAAFTAFESSARHQSVVGADVHSG